MKVRTLAVAALVMVGAGTSPAPAKFSSKVAPQAKWTELKSPHFIYPTGDAIYYSFPVTNGSMAHLIVVNTKGDKWQIRPAISTSTEPTSIQTSQQKGSAGVNGGFFNISDGVSTSYVTVNEQQVADPKTNKALVDNPKLTPFLPQIFDRSEVRFLQDKAGKSKISIAKHSEAVPSGMKLVHSLQAGPRLLPTLTDKEEAFSRKESDGKEVDSINGKRPAARTAFGITEDGYAMILAVSGNGQDNSSSGVTLGELAELMKKLGCTEAINLDGGASTTMFVKLSPVNAAADAPPGTVVCGKSPETKVKSVLLIEPKK